MTYFNNYAEELVSELVPNARIKRFLTNTDVIGAYAESTVIRLIKNMVSPLRVSTGAVISPKLVEPGGHVPQIDVIVWQPCPLPAIFTSGEFGLVPRQSVMGILEVKRSAYSGIGQKIKVNIDLEDELTTSFKMRYTDGGIVPSSLGVVCVREQKTSDAVLDDLIEKKRVVVLTEIDSDGNIKPLPEQIFVLVNFLANLQMKAKHVDGQVAINLDSIEKLKNSKEERDGN